MCRPFVISKRLKYMEDGDVIMTFVIEMSHRKTYKLMEIVYMVTSIHTVKVRPLWPLISETWPYKWNCDEFLCYISEPCFLHGLANPSEPLFSKTAKQGRENRKQFDDLWTMFASALNDFLISERIPVARQRCGCSKDMRTGTWTHPCV